MIFCDFLCVTDLDECEPGGGNMCSLEAQCKNLNASYACTCKPGYSVSGYDCTGMCEYGLC